MEPTRTIQRRHAFGVSGAVADGLCWLDEGTLMYPVGKSIALHTVATNNQRFLDGSYQSKSITALAVSANKKFVAIAESGDLAQVQIIDTVTRKRRKVLSAADLGSDRFVSLSFSADGRHLVTQGGAPSWNLLYWNWERSKPLAAVSLVGAVEANVVASVTTDVLGGSRAGSPMAGGRAGGALGGLPLVTAVHISPSDPLTVTVSGVGMMRYYRYADGVLQLQPASSFPGQQSEAFITHAWISDRAVVASTYKGNVILIEDGSFRGTILSSMPGDSTYSVDGGTLVECITPTRDGFLAGTNLGDILVYEHNDAYGEMSDGGAGFRCVARLRVPDSDAGGGSGGESESPPRPSHLGGGGARSAAPASPAASYKISGSPTGQATNVSETRSVFNVTAPRGAGRSAEATGAATPLANTVMTSEGSATPASKRGTAGGAAVVPAGRVGTARSDERTSSAGGPFKTVNSVAGLSLDQAEESLAIATSGGKIYALNFRQNWSTLSPEVYPPFESICQSFHTGCVNGMACSVRKPLLITSGVDHTVRVWNTEESRLVMCERYQQEPGAVALHPSGLMAIVCFPDKVRVMSVLWNSLRERKVINFRNSNIVKFSYGGQYFAIAHNNIIDVFNSSTCELVGQLRGHPQKITDMSWCSTSPYPLDDRIVSCSQDGMIIDWSVTDMHKEAEHTNKRFIHTAVASDDRYIWTVASPASTGVTDSPWRVTLRELDRHTLALQNADSEEYEFAETQLCSLVVAPHQRMMFAGTEDGSLKVMTFPLQAGVQESPMTAHAGRVTQVVLTFDEQTLFTSSDDGSIFIWDVRDEQRHGKPGSEPAASLSDEVLVTKRELEERALEVDSLKQQIEKLRTSIESEEKRRNHEQGTRVREKAEEFKSDAANLSSEYASLWNAKAEQERAFMAVKMEKEAEASKAMEQLERARQEEVQALESECAAMQRTLESEKVLHAESLQALEEQIETDKIEDAAHFQDVLNQRKEALEKLKRQVDRARRTNEEARHQLELDTDAESQGVRGQHSSDLATVRDRYLHMKGEGAIMRKNAARMEKEIELRAGEIRLLDSAKAALTAQLTDLSHQMQQLHQDIEERDNVIGDKEKRIYALKKQNQELEKHKFVLDHRIRQLKAQMEPKQREIAQQNSKIKLKNNELEEFHSNNLALRANAEELKQELAQQQQQTKQLLSGIKDSDTYKGRVQRDVGELAPTLQDSALLRTTIQQLYDTHVKARGGERVAQADPKIREEFQAQLGYLSTSVDALRRKVKSDQERHKKEVSDMMVDNLALIHEIHELRAEIAQLRSHIAADESAKRSGAALAKKKGRLEKERQEAQAETPAAAPTPASSSASPVRPVLTVSGATTRYVGGITMDTASGTAAGGGGTRKGGSASSVVVTTAKRAANSSSKRPDPPKEIEDNRMELRMQRAYIEAMQRSLAEFSASRPGSTHLPPLSGSARTNNNFANFV